MKAITCTKCGAQTEVEELTGDYSTYVCIKCQGEINQPAYKVALAELKAKKGRTESEDRRIEYLETKITGETPAE